MMQSRASGCCIPWRTNDTISPVVTTRPILLASLDVDMALFLRVELRSHLSLETFYRVRVEADLTQTRHLSPSAEFIHLDGGFSLEYSL